MTTTDKQADAADAARRAEANGEGQFTVKWRDLEFICERDASEWSVQLLRAMRQGADAPIIDLVEGILGPEQMRTLEASQPPPKKKDLMRFYEDWNASLGTDPGESSASSG